MTDNADLAAEVLRQGWAAAPSVSRLRTDVRSGENFLIGTSAGLPKLFVAAVVVEWGYEVPKPKSDAFRQWLIANETALATECPPGIAYRGTYGVFAQSAELGSYRSVWAFDSLAALEGLSAEVTAGTPFGQRLQALTAFRDESIGAARSQQIYHPAAIATRT